MRKTFFKKSAAFCAVVSLLSLQNCATVFNSGSQSIVASAAGDVENVKVEITTPDGSYRAKLPSNIVTSPSSFRDTTIQVKDKCYDDTQVKVGKSVTPSFWVNFLWGFGFPIAMGIDYLDGTMWKMDRQIVVPVDAKGKC